MRTHCKPPETSAAECAVRISAAAAHLEHGLQGDTSLQDAAVAALLLLERALEWTA